MAALSLFHSARHRPPRRLSTRGRKKRKHREAKPLWQGFKKDPSSNNPRKGELARSLREIGVFISSLLGVNHRRTGPLSLGACL